MLTVIPPLLTDRDLRGLLTAPRTPSSSACSDGWNRAGPTVFAVGRA